MIEVYEGEELMFRGPVWTLHRNELGDYCVTFPGEVHFLSSRGYRFIVDLNGASKSFGLRTNQNDDKLTPCNQTQKS